ncbi:alpha/beta fold hydrolase [Rhodococcus artemisiae]|uniref:Alpha/beta hydrolase n=1 Tax=Rhodococcus artemisiae TaxID=714159 RepID=A0ABU7L6P4_9NOCA|nr:alpha/beta hydrolase [Rhodococcus artemisiae]MEE2057204.1 alpha/beta hydrolase [Rhodococcus artemisiae]
MECHSAHTIASAEIEVVGCPIHYSIHGVGQRPIVLVHGFGAHQMWWHRVVPLLSDEFSVITVDLSGNGRSGLRSAYNPEIHAQELAAVARSVGAGPALVVGHSMGGRSSVVAAAAEPALFGGLVVLDTGFRTAVRKDDAQRTVRPQRMYRTYEEIRERFRLEPPQPALPKDVIDPVAAYAVHQTANGWTWRADLRPPSFSDTAVNEAWRAVRCPVAYAYGTLSTAPVIESLPVLRGWQPDIDIRPMAGAHHHLPLERPDECADVIRTVAARMRW